MTDSTDELIRAVIGQEVDRWFLGQEGWLMDNIFSGCKETDSTEKIYSMMVVNSIMTSVKIAADMTISFLIKAGISEPKSEDELRKRLMSVVRQEPPGHGNENETV